jgi:hypothetical protein
MILRSEVRGASLGGQNLEKKRSGTLETRDFFGVFCEIF